MEGVVSSPDPATRICFHCEGEFPRRVPAALTVSRARFFFGLHDLATGNRTLDALLAETGVVFKIGGETRN
jgi:hypothetical protein